MPGKSNSYPRLGLSVTGLVIVFAIALAGAAIFFLANSVGQRRDKEKKLFREQPMFGLGIKCDQFRMTQGRFPTNGYELLSYDTDLAKEVIFDQWGKEYLFSLDSVGSLVITTFGADGKQGGWGTNKDEVCVMQLVRPLPPAPITRN